MTSFKRITIRLVKTISFILLFVALLVTGLWLYSTIDIRHRKDKVYPIDAENIHIRRDSASIALGGRLAATRACQECHGANLGGKVIFEDPLIGTFVSRNLTRGRGGLPADYSPADWVLAMKHGVGRDKKPLYLMPSHELSQLSEEDMAALIAYCEQVPAVDSDLPGFRVGPLAYILTEFDQIPLLPAEMTDHSLPFAPPVARAITPTYGKYVAAICVNCHGKNLKGGSSPVPGGKYVADITSTGNPGRWSHQEFIKALKTGQTPEGKQMNPEEMPWTITSNFTDEELTALHLYLKSLP